LVAAAAARSQRHRRKIARTLRLIKQFAASGRLGTVAEQRQARQWDRLNRAIVRCSRCPRLRRYCREVAQRKRRAFRDWTYWARPVPNFGDPAAELLIIGLAPAAHGANRTGRLFTGDRSGEWLFRALHKAGYANQAHAASRDDGLELSRCAITAVCHCAPPANRPAREELAACRRWLRRTLELVPARTFVALGRIAWQELLSEARRRNWLTDRPPPFRHGLLLQVAGQRRLIASYHPSQQNTVTGRLTEPMFDRIFEMARP